MPGVGDTLGLGDILEFGDVLRVGGAPTALGASETPWIKPAGSDWAVSDINLYYNKVTRSGKQSPTWMLLASELDRAVCVSGKI
jgi:hypothetical protein